MTKRSNPVYLGLNGVKFMNSLNLYMELIQLGNETREAEQSPEVARHGDDGVAELTAQVRLRLVPQFGDEDSGELIEVEHLHTASWSVSTWMAIHGSIDWSH